MSRRVGQTLASQCIILGSRAARPAAMSSRSFTQRASPYQFGAHRSNAEIKVNSVPVIEIDGHVAICDGGSGTLGHPVESIELDLINFEPVKCKYCGLRFKSSHGAHGHGDKHSHSHGHK